MYELKRFFDNLLKIVWKIALFIFIIMALFYSYNLMIKSQEKPAAIKVKVTNKFEEDKGFVLFNQNVNNSGKVKKIRVEFIDDNNETTNIFTVTNTDYDHIEEGKNYVAKFKSGKLGYIQIDNPPAS